jgi:probable HAF family extracellular repeat protein
VVGYFVGTSEKGIFGSRAFLYRQGRRVALPSLGSGDTQAFGVNNRGEVVGIADTGKDDPRHRPFLYRNGRVWDLNELIPAGTGWRLEYAVAINDRGQIVGAGRLKGGAAHAVLLTPEG